MFALPNMAPPPNFGQPTDVYMKTPRTAAQTVQGQPVVQGNQLPPMMPAQGLDNTYNATQNNASALAMNTDPRGFGDYLSRGMGGAPMAGPQIRGMAQTVKPPPLLGAQPQPNRLAGYVR